MIALLIILIPANSSAQTSLTNQEEKAPIVIDGREQFLIGKVENYSASERASIINEALAEQLRSPQDIILTVVQLNGQTVIRSKTTESHIMTVTATDVISGTNVITQAQVWQNKLEAALKQAKLERSPNYLRQAWLFTIGVLIGVIIIQVILQYLGKLASRQLLYFLGDPTSELHAWEQPSKLLLQLTKLGMQLVLWITVIHYLTDIFPIARSWRYQLLEFLNSPIFTLGKSQYSAIGLIVLVALTVGLWFAVKVLVEVFKIYVLDSTGVDSRAQDIIIVFSQYIVTFLGLIVLWQIWGLDVGSFAILASVLGVGIGFGLQNITNDFISGLIITLERPIQLGDFINVGGLVGTVKRIGARSTEILTMDQVSIIVPNSRFLVNEVINWNHSDPVSRLHIPVGVAYGSNVEKVKAALLDAARSHPDVLLRPRPQVWFLDFGESSLNFDLLVWIGEPKKQFIFKSELNYLIEASLRRYGLSVPFPQRDLHLRTPQLEQLINLLLRQQNIEPKETKPESTSLADETEVSAFSTLPMVTNLSSDSLENRLTAVEIENIITQMQGEGGLEIRERRYRFNVYDSCFIGSEAVNWLRETQNWTRDEAVDFGQILIDRGIIHHVTDEHPFKDAYLFYRFYCDEN